MSAAARYDELMLRHPEAFVDHAAEFWLTVGGDSDQGAPAGSWNHISRATRAPAILHRVIRAADGVPTSTDMTGAFIYG